MKCSNGDSSRAARTLRGRAGRVIRFGAARIGWPGATAGTLCLALIVPLVLPAGRALSGEGDAAATQPSAAATQPNQAGNPPTQAAVAGMVKKLGDSAWKTRETAQSDLVKAGEAAVEELEKALNSDDPEVRLRSQTILQAIRKDTLESAILAMEKARLWKSPAKEGVASSAVASGGVVCFRTVDGGLCAVDANTGKGRWSFDAAAKEAQARNPTQLVYGLPTLPAPLIAAGQVYISAQYGHLYALSLDKGEVAWKSASGDGFAPPAVAGGRVYAAGTEKDLLALDANTGKETWRADLEGGCTVRPVVIGPAVYVAARDNNLYAFDANTGVRRTIGSSLLENATDLVATADGGLVARTSEGLVRVEAAKPKDSVLWTYPVAMDVQQAAIMRRQVGGNLPVRQGEETLVIAGGVLYITAGGEVHAVDANTGKGLWTYKPPPPEDNGAANPVVNRLFMVAGQGRFIVRSSSGADYLSAPCVESGMLYVASTQGLHAVDIKSRAELWRLREQTTIMARPAVARGALYFGTADLTSMQNARVAALQAAQAGQPAGANQPPDNEAGLHAVRLNKDGK